MLAFGAHPPKVSAQVRERTGQGGRCYIYTLAQYRPDTFEALAHSQTVNKLVRHFGYPEVLRSFTFSWDWMMKGLILDKVAATPCHWRRQGKATRGMEASKKAGSLAMLSGQGFSS
ncbi:hypothetical protein QJQ45_003130 [Haematococcus lacustris]|nr:hypothetical protein QJQ45_003130 [Haematococcus lacustris]